MSNELPGSSRISEVSWSSAVDAAIDKARGEVAMCRYELEQLSVREARCPGGFYQRERAYHSHCLTASEAHLKRLEALRRR